MATVLDQPNVVEAAIFAGAHFGRFFRTVVIHPGPANYMNLSLFDLAILGGHKQTANVLCRAQMAWIALKVEDLDWEVQWRYKVEIFNSGQLLEQFQKVALPTNRWKTVAYVMERALSRAGAKYGPALLQLLARLSRLFIIDGVLPLVIELPPGLCDLIPMAKTVTGYPCRRMLTK